MMDTQAAAMMLVDTLRNAGSTDEEIYEKFKGELDKIAHGEVEANNPQNPVGAFMGIYSQLQHDNGNVELFKAVCEIVGPDMDAADAAVAAPHMASVTTVHVLATEPDLQKIQSLVASNYTGVTHTPVFHGFEAGHITSKAVELLQQDPTAKAICVAPNPRFMKDFENYLGVHAKPGSYKVKQVGGFTSDDILTDWPSITANELLEALKTSLEGRCEDFSPLNGSLQQIEDLQMEIRGHGVALFVITTPDGKTEPYELKLELRKLNE
jgi:hypothetical protein